MERRRGRQEKTEETVVSSGWRGKDRKGFLFVYLTPPSFGQLPYILLRYRLGERGKSFALNSFLPFRNFGGVHVSLLPCLVVSPIYKKRESRRGFSLSGSLSYKLAATYSPTCAVPSAWRGLTSLFGMGRGGSPAL